MPRISTNKIAMGVGTAGAMVDVTASVKLDRGITFGWGTQDQFRPVGPTTWTFYLDNQDGRYTPNNPNSTLATTLVEGMAVSWQLGIRLLAGTILSIGPAFDGDVSAWAVVAVTVDDALGVAARTDIGALADSIDQAAGLLAYFSMDGDSNTAYTADTVGGLGIMTQSPYLPTPNAPQVAVFGQPPVPGLTTNQVKFYANAELNYFEVVPRTETSIPYPTTSLGGWGVWITPDASSAVEFDVSLVGLSNFIAVIYQSGTFTFSPGTGTALTKSFTPGPDLYRPHFVAWTSSTTFASGHWTITLSFYVDGVLIGSTNYAQVVPTSTVTVLGNNERQPDDVRFLIGDGITNGSVVVSRLSHTLNLQREDLAVGTNETQRLQALDAIVPAMTMDAIPSDLSQQPIGVNTPTGSVLDALNDVIKTEQGYIWTTAEGTLLSPTQLVEVRARQRPATPVTTFDVERELQGSPSFVRDIANMLARVDVSGANVTRSYYDGTVSGRVGSASGSESILNSFTGDMEAWAQDRLLRGKNVTPRIVSVVVDALTTPTDRSADILSLRPGDRVSFTNLPNTQLGFTTWDGWLLGGTESHTVTEHKFTLYFAPVLDMQTALFDGALFASGGDLYLTTAATAGATTIKVNTNGGGTPSTGVSYPIQIDQEQMSVTAVTGGGGSDWTLTVTRGINGTTAATHAVNALVELADVAGTPLRINWYPNAANQNAVGGLHGGAVSYSVNGGTGTFSIATGNYQQMSVTSMPANSRFGFYYDVPVNVPVGTQIATAVFYQNNTGPAPVRLWMDTFNASGVIVGSNAPAGSTASTGTLNAVVTPTDNVTRIRFYVWQENATGSTIGASSTQVARYMVEVGVPVAGSFFYGGSTGAHWSGVQDNSPSVIGGKTALTQIVF